jgi:hypothetical protein
MGTLPERLLECKSLSNSEKILVLQKLEMEIELEKLQKTLELEAIAQKTTLEVPKITREIQIINQEIEKFSQLVITSQQTLQKEYQKITIFEKIVQLDTIKENMILTRNCLKDADNWSTVSSEMESLFAANDLSKASVRLKDAEKSLELLSTSSNYHERRLLLDNLVDKFKVLLDIEITKNFTENNLDDIIKNVELYECVNQNVIDQYFHFRSSVYQNHWDASETAEITVQIERYFKSILVEFENDFELFDKIFKKSVQKLHMLLSKLLVQIDPLLKKLLIKAVEESPLFLHTMAKLFKTIVEFGVKFETKYAMEYKDGELPNWGHLMFKEFKKYQLNYEVLERKTLDFILKSLTSNFLPDTQMVIKSIDDCIFRYQILTISSSSIAIANLIDSYIVQAISKMEPGFINPLKSKVERGVLTTQMFNITPEYESGLRKEIEKLDQCVTFCINLQNQKTKSFKGDFNIPDGICKANVIYNEVTETKTYYWKFDLKELVSRFQRNVIDSLLVPINDFLSSVPFLLVWGEIGDESNFTMSPLAYITCIGEHLLTIPHLFDPFQQEECLKYSNLTLPFSNLELSKDPLTDENTEEDYDLLHYWIKSVVRVVEDNYFRALLQIKKLSKIGKKQAQADIMYLKNVMSVLEIDAKVELEFFLAMIKCLTKDEVGEVVKANLGVDIEIVNQVEMLLEL